jgi:regulator of protease activity HflC (stomatin/prohibitin superfamily)
MVRVDLRTRVFDVPAQDVISRDNVSVKVNAVVYFRVVEPQLSIIQVANFIEATSQLAQTTLRAVLGKHELDQMLAEREKLNVDIQEVLDRQTDAWGIKVSNVEIKHVDLNENMVRAIARQAEAERERRAKVCATCRRSPRSPTSAPRRSCSQFRSTCCGLSCANREPIQELRGDEVADALSVP